MSQNSASAERQTGAQLLIASSFARRAPHHRELAQALGAGLQALRTRGFVAATAAQVQQAAAECGLDVDANQFSAAALTACPLVGGATEHSPVVSDSGLLYFRLNFELERQLAEMLATRARARSLSRPPPIDTTRLAPGQARAMTAAAENLLTVVSGGPGTGKTTSVAALISACLSAGFEAVDIAIAAPTGKAAARLNSALSAALGAALPGTGVPEAGTIHRLLGWRPQQAVFHHHAGAPLPQRLVVIDEVSMVDLQLMHALLSALSPGTGLVLLGDKDQLVSVQPGSILADLFAGLQDTGGLFELDHSFRFSDRSKIAGLARAIRDGNAEQALCHLRPNCAELQWLPDISGLEQLINPYRQALSRSDDHQAWRELGNLRVLCAHRHGPYGAGRMNQRIMALLGLSDPGTAPEAIRPGMLFAITGNHYGQRFFNGDQGFVRRADVGDSALVERPDGSLRELSVVRLPAVEPAFAMTVHRAQGSEFEQVVILLPPPESPLLTRELLYTAVTRARSQVTLIGSEAAVRIAIGRPSQRGSGLAARLSAKIAGRSAANPADGVQGDLF